MIDYELLARVSNARGISGFEGDIQEVSRQVLTGCCDETSRDRMGNIIGLRRAPADPARAGRVPRVALAAHADEIGMMAKHITPEGFVKFQPIGGLHRPSIVSQRVEVIGREVVQGVIVPNHGLEDSVPAFEDLYIDLGRPVDEVRDLVPIGSPINLVGEIAWLNDHVVVGRNFDDRIGVYCLLEAMRRLEHNRVDVYAVSTVQEEVGVRGIAPAAFAIEADIGIAIDGSITKGPYREPHDPTCELGGGAGVYIMDRLTIGDPRLVAFLLDLAEEHGIAAQRNIGGGTDASVLQRSRMGALSTTVGAPVRYMHSTVQLCHVDDIEATVSLLVCFLEHAHELLED